MHILMYNSPKDEGNTVLSANHNLNKKLCAKFSWNWPSCSGEEDENMKSLQTDGQTDRQTDKRTDGDARRSEKDQLRF